MGMMAAYWSEDGLGVYRLGTGNQSPVKVASGDLNSLKPIRGILSKKVLIIGRDHLHHARRRYPPASQKEIRKAVAFEIEEIFPLKEPAFYCRVFETYKTHVLVDVWGWEKGDYRQIRKVFPFLYAVPEDLAFSSRTGSVKIYRQGKLIHLVAHGINRFIGAATFPAARFESSDLQRFLVSLEPYASEIQEIVEFGSSPVPKPPDMTQPVASRPLGEYPPVLACLDELSSVRQFLILPDFNVWEKRHLLFRASLYMVLGYAGMLYLTMIYCDQEIQAIRLKTAQLTKTLQTIDVADTGSKDRDNELLLQEFNNFTRKTSSPLTVMYLLSQHLPEATYVSGLQLTEHNLEASLVSANPLEVVKALSRVKEISKVQMKGIPAKDAKSGAYKFSLIMDLT